MDSQLLLYTPSPTDRIAFASVAQLLDALVFPVAYCDASHRYRFVNAAFARRFRFVAEQFIGKSVSDADCPDALALSESTRAWLLEGNFVSEEREASMDGESASWWQLDYYPNRARSGSVAGYFVFAREITSQKELEQAVGERGEQVRKLVESIMLPMARWDRDARIVYCNAPYESWVGRSKADILGKSHAEIFGATAWAVSKASFERAFTGLATSYERQVRQSSGEVRWHRVQVFPDQSGELRPDTVFTIAFDIDDDIRLRQQLAANEARLRSVLESIDVPIARFGPDLTILYCNSSYAEFVDKHPQEIVGRSIGQLFGETVFREVEARYLRAFAGESITYDRLTTHKGIARWVRVRLLPDRDASGVARSIVCSVYDIDADVRARQRLEEARLRLDKFTDSIPFPLTYIDRDEKYRFANRAFRERHALSDDQVVGKHPANARGAQVWERYKPYFLSALSGSSVTYERPVALASGETRWTRTLYAPDIADDGSVRGVYTSSFDIHELKQAQTEIARMDALLRTHLSRSPVAFVEYDQQGLVTQWSNRAEEILGFTGEQMIGTKISLQIVHPDDRAEVAKVIERILSANTAVVTNTHRYRHRDGHHVWIEWNTSIIRAENGEIQSIVSLGVDQTERMEARIRLQRLADRIPTPITYVGADLRYQFMNATFTRWLGIGADQMIGKTPTEVRGAALGGLFEDLIKKALAGDEVSIERKVELADGRERWAKTLFTPDYDDAGHVIGCYNVSFDIHEAKQLEATLQAAADHDWLTAALSRRAFFAELDRMLALRSGSAVSLLFGDLDGFKAVNDQLGHAAGDELLVQVHERIRAQVGPQDLIGRLGGDEFVILTRTATRSAVEKLARDIVATIESITINGSSSLRISVSIGIAQTLCNAQAPTSDELVKRADHAMYEAKREGGARLRFAD
jgi:diguanylate cyclase (GGDEF)-like protein/PAS domain S-box-containing protein